MVVNTSAVAARGDRRASADRRHAAGRPPVDPARRRPLGRRTAPHRRRARRSDGTGPVPRDLCASAPTRRSRSTRRTSTATGCGSPSSICRSPCSTWLAVHGRPIRYGYVDRPWPISDVPERVRHRAGQRRDAERRPAVHARGDHPARRQGRRRRAPGAAHRRRVARGRPSCRTPNGSGAGSDRQPRERDARGTAVG